MNGQHGDADVVIAGAGTAGLALALALAEAGQTVQLLEKTGRHGGTLHISSGMFSAGGTRRQRERGIDDSPEAHFQDVLRISHGTVNRDLVRLYCTLAPGMVDWLDDNGFEFEPSCPVVIYGHEPYSVPRTYWGAENGRSILKVLDRLLVPYRDSGQVRIAFETPAERLVLEDGRVAGIEAGGREWRARNVVLTTGGYSSNPELFARFTAGRRLVSIGMESSTGDGHRLAEAAGAELTGSQFFLPTFGGLEDPDRPGRVYQREPDTWDTNPQLVPQNRAPWEIWVNARGERFIREDDPSVDNRERRLLEQPDMRFWLVFDEPILDAAPPLFPIWSAADLRAMAREGKLVKQAGSLEELARLMEVPFSALQETVGAYNEAIERGTPDPVGREHRPLPVRQAPFYAIKQQGIVLRTWAGIRVDTELRAVRPDGSVIPGLYALGEALGAHTFSGDSFAGGMSIGPCLALSRYLAPRLASAAATPATGGTAR